MRKFSCLTSFAYGVRSRRILFYPVKDKTVSSLQSLYAFTAWVITRNADILCIVALNAVAANTVKGLWA